MAVDVVTSAPINRGNEAIQHFATVQGLLDYAALAQIVSQAAEHNRMAKLTEYMLTAAAAEYIGVAQNTIRKWAARGEIPMHRNPANGYRLFKRSDLDKFLNTAAKTVEHDRRSVPS